MISIDRYLIHVWEELAVGWPTPATPSARLQSAWGGALKFIDPKWTAPRLQTYQALCEARPDSSLQASVRAWATELQRACPWKRP